MRVKRYEAPTLQEALLDVKRELGSDAVILQTRKFSRGGLLGMFGKEMVEVLAATEVNTPSSPATAPPARQPTGILEPPPRREIALPPSAQKDELREIKNVLKTLLARDSTSPSSNPYQGLFGDYYMKLIENDVDIPVAQDVMRALEGMIPEEERNQQDVVRPALERHLKRLLKISGAIDFNTSGAPRTVAFVGPTGVGKTTTVAKLAAHFTLAKKKRVGIITADTYRIAAVEQIKTYGEILDIPVRVVYNEEDMKRSMEIFSDRDLILIDTAGRSHRDVDRIEELKEILSACYPLEIHLVLGANTRLREMHDAAERFRMLSYNYFTFTKLDEAATYGTLISVIAKTNNGVAYLCFGQNVPEAIEPASSDKLTQLILGRPFENVFANAR